MQEKEQIELYLSKLFLEMKFTQHIDKTEIIPGNPLKSEPDILYKDFGIEFGAVLKGNNTHLDKYENEFLKYANTEIKNKIPANLKLSLVMQDDKDIVVHSPNLEFEKYKYLPEFLDGIFIDKFPDNYIFSNQIVLNQKPLIRVNTFPNVKNKKIFFGFINELVDYVDNLNNKDFFISPFDSNNKLHHKVVCHAIEIKKRENPLDDFISMKIIDKLKNDKYKGNHQMQVLILHNFSTLANSEFTTDIHFYSHYRDFIFNRIAELIVEFNSFTLYDDIYFMDFSHYFANMNFEMIDFKILEIKDLNYDILNDGHIRGNLSKK